MNINVPAPVAGYLAAEKAKDAARLSQCFHEDAVVRDEGREHRGIDAIRAWKQDADAKYQFVVEPLEASTNDPVVVVSARLTGDFPGSPAILRFQFTLEGEHIASLEVKP